MRSKDLAQNPSYIISKNAGPSSTSGEQWAVVYNSSPGLLEFYTLGQNGTSPRPFSQIPVSDLEWHHYAFTYNGLNFITYRDGQVVQNTPVNFNLSPINTGDKLVYLGATRDHLNALGSFANVELDEVRIWGKPRTQPELNIFKDIPFLTADNGLLAYWRMDESNGTFEILDVSCNGYIGRAINSPGSIVSKAMHPYMPKVCARPSGLTTATLTFQDLLTTDLASFNVYTSTDSITWNLATTNATSPFALNTLTSNVKNYIAVEGIDLAGQIGNRGISVIVPVLESGRALSLNGTNQFVTIPNSPLWDFETNQDFTVDLWFKTTDSEGDLVSTWANSSNGYSFVVRVFNGLLQVAQYDNQSVSVYFSSMIVNDGVYHHVAFVKNGSEFRVYIDGKLDGTFADITNFETRNFGQLLLGKRHLVDTQSPYNGEIDELRIWNVAKTQTEINAYKDKTSVGNEAGLVGLWHFDEPTGNVLYDATCNGLNGTIINGAGTIVSKAMHPYKPDSLKATAVNFNSVQLAWSKNKAFDVAQVRIFKSNSPFTVADTTGKFLDVKTISNQNDTTFIDSDVSLCQTYWYRVVAVDQNGQIGVVSDLDSASLFVKPPSNVYALVNKDEVELHWSKTANHSASIVYTVSFGEDSTSSLLQTATFLNDTILTIGGLEFDKIYQFSLDAGCGASRFEAAVPRVESGRAFNTNGGTGYLEGNLSNTNTNEFTLEAWFKRTATSTTNQMIALNGSTHLHGYGIYVEPNGRLSGVFGDVTIFSTNVITELNTWYHVALVRRQGQNFMYLDGVEFLLPFTEAPLPFANGKVIIGRNGLGVEPFLGEIDEVRYWNRALSASEINQGKDQPVRGNALGLTAVYHLDEPNGYGKANNGAKVENRLTQNGGTFVNSKAMHPYKPRLIAEPSDDYTFIRLTWDVNKALDVDRIFIYRQINNLADTSGNFLVSIPYSATNTSYDDNNDLSLCLTYDYQIVMVDKSGQIGVLSNKDTSRVCPPPPANVFSIAENGQVTVHWSKIRTHDANTTYYVEYSNDIDFSTIGVISAPGDTSLTIPTLTNNQIYSFGVRPNSSGEISELDYSVPKLESGRALNLAVPTQLLRKTNATGLPKGNEAFTWEIWFKANNVNNEQRLFSWGELSNLPRSSNSVALQGGNVIVRHADVLNTYEAKLKTNLWYHLAGSFDGNSEIIYLNGISLGTRNIGSLNVGEGFLCVGNIISGIIAPTSTAFNGEIDEMRIWNRALSQVEIEALRDIPALGTESGLVGLWHFDEPIINQFFSAQFAFDNSRYKNDLTASPSLQITQSSGAMRPFVLDTIRFSQTPTLLSLDWDANLALDNSKFKIYKSLSPNLDTAVASNLLAEVSATTLSFEDPNLLGCQKAYYKIVGIDLNNQIGMLSKEFEVLFVGNPFIVTSAADDSSCGTLRFAIGNANLATNSVQITFEQPFNITLSKELPEIVATVPVRIDGNVNGSKVVITGNNADYVFRTSSNSTSFENLVLNRIGNHGIGIENAEGVIIRNVVLGLNADLTLSNNSSGATGIRLNNAPNAIIESNVIGGLGEGILLENGSNNIKLSSNYIGITPNEQNIRNSGVGVLLRGDVKQTVFSGNFIANNNMGIRLNGTAVNGHALYDNRIFQNTLKGIEIINGAQNGIEAPQDLDITFDSTLVGKADAGALVTIYADTRNQGRLIVDQVNADENGIFNYKISNNLAERLELGGLDFLTTIQHSNNNSSEFSDPIFVRFCRRSPFSINVKQDTLGCEGIPITLVASRVKRFDFEWFKDNVSMGPKLTGDTSYVANLSGRYFAKITGFNCEFYTDTIGLTFRKVITQPELSITADKPQFCLGDEVVFSIVSAKDTGDFPAYQWMRNNQMISNETNNQLVISSLQPGDAVWLAVEVTDTDKCIIDTTGASNRYFPAITLLDNVNIGADQLSCKNGRMLNFSGTSLTSNGLIWSSSGNGQLNFSSLGSNSATYRPSIADYDRDSVFIYAVNTEAVKCGKFRDTLVVRFEDYLPSLTLISTADTLCEKQKVNFELVNIVRPGAAPIYRWLLNGVEVAINQNTFSGDAFNDGDEIQVEMLSNDTCVSKPMTMSNVIKLKLGRVISPLVPINLSGQLCGSDVPLLSTSSNFVEYQWFVNDMRIAGAESPQFSPSVGGEYQIRVVSASGNCLFSNKQTVNAANNNPSISLRNGVLQASNAQIYQWYVKPNENLGERLIVGRTTNAYEPKFNGQYFALLG
ncbi:MAG: LamG-like jellyroll fold domain-containing protein, partial [Cytophagales bacterium]